MELVTQPINCLSIPPHMNATMGSDSYIPIHYREMTSYDQRVQQIDAALKQLFSINCGKRHPGYKEACTTPERRALKLIHEARALEDNIYNNNHIRWLYVDALAHLERLDRNCYTTEKYIALQELKVSCKWFVAQYSGNVGQIATRVFALQLADLCKERSKIRDSAAPFYLLRSAELRIQAAQDFYDPQQASQWLKESIYDLTVMSRNSSFWSKEIRTGESFYDRKVELLNLARTKLEALKNPSLLQRMGNAFQWASELLDRWAGPII